MDVKRTGKIKSITDFGIFIGLPGEIDGLIHLSDILWSDSGEEAVKKYKKADELEAIIISIDVEKERISLGIKQLAENPNPEIAEKSDTTVAAAEKATKPKKTAAKKSEPEVTDGGTTNLGALLKAKLDDKK